MLAKCYIEHHFYNMFWQCTKLQATKTDRCSFTSYASFLLQTFRHGFPFQPTAVAFDPIQRLLALGTKTGSLRLYPFQWHTIKVRKSTFCIIGALLLWDNVSGVFVFRQDGKTVLKFILLTLTCASLLLTARCIENILMSNYKGFFF